jgi:hypothetical protein
MAYNYADSRGWLALGPSIGGVTALFDALKKIDPRPYPNVHELLTTGECASPDAVNGEALRLARKIKNRDVKDTLLRMAKAAAKAKGYLAVTH